MIRFVIVIGSLIAFFKFNFSVVLVCLIKHAYLLYGVLAHLLCFPRLQLVQTVGRFYPEYVW